MPPSERAAAKCHSRSGHAGIAARMWPLMLLCFINISPLADIEPLGLSPSWIALVGAVMVVMYLTFRPKKRDPLASQPFRTSLAQQKSLERDMQNVIVELSEMTRQMTSQLETRAAKLEQLMTDADAKLAELRSATENARPTSVDHPAEFTAIASDVITPAQTSTNRPAMRLVTEHTEDRWAEVYRLGDEGLTLPEIARRLARPNGEVELILALRPKPAPAESERENVAASELASAQ